MGIRGSGFIPTRIGTEPTIDDARPVGPCVPRFRNVGQDKQRGLHPRLSPRAAAARASIQAWRAACPASARGSSRTCGSTIRAPIALGGFGEVLPRKEKTVTLDPEVKDAWGGPVLKFDFKFGRQREEDGQRHGRDGGGDVEGGRAPKTSRSAVRSAARRLVDPRGRHGADGQRSEAPPVTEQVLPAARRVENVRICADASPFVIGRHAEHDVGRFSRCAGGRWTSSKRR